MPTSTPWLQSNNLVPNGCRTPPRPSIDAIERLSPDYEPSLDDLRYQPLRGTHSRTYQNDLQGLGLSYSSGAAQDFPGASNGVHSLGYQNGQNGPIFAVQEPEYTTGMKRPRSYHARPHTRDGPTTKRSRTKGHTRSGSTIDDLATAAIATSPTFLNGSPPMSRTARPATSYNHAYDYFDAEKPAKRIRSEKLPTTEWFRNDPRAGSSPDLDLMTDAELLLGLRVGFDFKKETVSPPNKFEEVVSPIQRQAEIHDVPSDTIVVAREDINVNGGTIEIKATTRPLSPRAPSVEPLEDDLQETEAFGDPSAEAPDAFATVNIVDKTADESEQQTQTQLNPSEVVSATVSEDLTNQDLRKKPKRIKPETEAQECATCHRFQRAELVNTATQENWIKCDSCGKWNHTVCVGIEDPREVQNFDHYHCAECVPIHGPSTYVRKSSRARTAIDYAELNHGLVKPPDHTRVHHWVQAIKAGKTFKPETFPRMRPELVTAETFAQSDGMQCPVLIPAEWNKSESKQSSSAANLEKPAEHDGEMDWTVDSNGATVDGDVVASHETFGEREVIDCGQDLLGMVIPKNLSVRAVSNIYGPNEYLGVIDVMAQEQDRKKAWTLQKWADYYESNDDKPVRNVISLEFSRNALTRVVRRPDYVRDMDLQDLVVPDHVTMKSVQYYCLMSVADSYTDFHIDFGGSAVYYHILKGKKVFFFIPPEEKNMKKYEDWNNSSTQNETFLGDLTGDCTRVDLQEGDTMLIPSGWIHAVWTPEDSLVIGGNFLTRVDYEKQFRVVQAEINTKCGKDFRYPSFAKIMWFALIDYLENDPVPQSVLTDFIQEEDHVHLRAHPVWLEELTGHDTQEPGDADFNARFYPKAEIEGLVSLRDYLLRSARIASDIPVTPEVNKTTIKAVKASIPKGHGDAMDLIRQFALWVAWKTGNMPLPDWAREDMSSLTRLLDPVVTEVKANGSLPEDKTTSVGASIIQFVPNQEFLENGLSDQTTKTSANGPKRIACEICRKRRTRCHHKDEPVTSITSEQARPVSRDSITIDGASYSASSPLLNGIDERQESSQLSTSAFPALQATHDYLPPGLAQAAFASMDGQDHPMSGQGSSMNQATKPKKGRNKACEPCRKSKRRCLHDDDGNIDPSKADEPHKPRASAAKRPASAMDDPTVADSAKKARMDNDTSMSSTSLMTSNDDSDFSSLIDPALMASIDQQPSPNGPSLEEASRSMQLAVDALQYSSQRLDQANNDFDRAFAENEVNLDLVDLAVAQGELRNHLSAVAENSNQSIKLEQQQSPVLEPANIEAAEGQQDNATVMEDRLPNLDGADGAEAGLSLGTGSMGATGALETPMRHSARQSKVVDRYVPETNRTSPKLFKTERRGSSSVSNGQSLSTSGKSRRSSSHTSATTHQIAAAVDEGKEYSGTTSARPGSSGSGAAVDADMENPDEALARALQMEELGLRRRASTRGS